jgi:hypothetical protein
MKADQVFGLLLILLAIYLGVTASGALDGGGVDEPGPVDVPPADGNGGGNGGDNGNGGNGGDNGGGGNGGGGDASGQGQPSGGDGDSSGQSQPSGGGEPVVASSDFCAAAPETSQFDDVGTAHDEAIRCMEGAEVIGSSGSDQFEPADGVTRGQAAMATAALIETANSLEAEGVDLQDLPPADDPRFEDFKDGSADCPGRQAVARLNETPVLQGYVDSRFEPCGNLTRAQMASLLDRTYQYLNGSALPRGPDRFRDDELSVHEDSINAVANAEIMAGRGNGRFMPQHDVLQGEMASQMTRMLIRMEEKGQITPLP